MGPTSTTPDQAAVPPGANAEATEATPGAPAGKENPTGPAPAADTSTTATGPAAAVRPAAATRSPVPWGPLVTTIVLAVVVLVFILQNQRRVKVSFLMVHWTIPLAVDLLFAAVLGAALVLAALSVRFVQHRRLARRQPRTPTSHP